MKRDWLPLLLIPALAVIALPLVGSPTSWVTLTVAGLAMGLMIFIMASGLTLTFGLMDVLNFGHGAFIAVGAFVAAEAGNLIMEPILMRLNLEGSLAATGHPMLYVSLTVTMLLMLLGSWLALQVVNRWR